MFIPTHKIITDYKITYEYEVPEDAIICDQVFEFTINNCKTYDEAFNAWCDNKEPGMVKDWFIQPREITHQDQVNIEVYELVLAEV